ncbi:hypothetical protein SFRURICE_005015 [Spodoptera frugiperda]|nr:hypothetical protein SFRURICE_005015 [Spodoptera frugiperda]
MSDGVGYSFHIGAGTTHFLRFDKVSVLAREKYFVPRKVREAIEISRRPNFNRDGGWALPPAWKPSLQSASAYNVAGLECDTCRDSGVVPKFAQIRPVKCIRGYEKFFRVASEKLLRHAISDYRRKLVFVNDHVYKLHLQLSRTLDVERTPAFLPYVKGVTDTIGHLLRRRYSIRTIFRPPGQLRNLLRSPKDKDPLAVPGVYMIPCDCGSSYIGETRRNITTRLKEHIRSVKNRDTHTSAVAEHACSAGTTHFLRFDKVSVLAREKYFVPRKVREAIEISRRPNFNRDGGWALPPAWKPSLQSASAYNVAGLECDTVSAVCDTVFASTRESNPTPAQPPASESNEPTSSRAPDSTRDSRQRARWARSSNRQ